MDVSLGPSSFMQSHIMFVLSIQTMIDSDYGLGYPNKIKSSEFLSFEPFYSSYQNLVCPSMLNSFETSSFLALYSRDYLPAFLIRFGHTIIIHSYSCSSLFYIINDNMFTYIQNGDYRNANYQIDDTLWNSRRFRVFIVNKS